MIEDVTQWRRRKSSPATSYRLTPRICLKAPGSGTWCSSKAAPDATQPRERWATASREQTRNTLDRIKLILEAAGTSLDNVMTNTCYLSRTEDMAAFNEVYMEYFTDDRPARTAIVVTFGAADTLVEVTSTACIPN